MCIRDRSNPVDNIVDMLLRCYWAQITDLEYNSYVEEHQWLLDNEEKVAEVLNSLARVVNTSWRVGIDDGQYVKQKFQQGYSPRGAVTRQKVWMYLINNPDQTVRQVAEALGRSLEIKTILNKMVDEGSIYTTNIKVRPRTFRAVKNFSEYV